MRFAAVGTPGRSAATPRTPKASRTAPDSAVSAGTAATTAKSRGSRKNKAAKGPGPLGQALGGVAGIVKGALHLLLGVGGGKKKKQSSRWVRVRLVPLSGSLPTGWHQGSRQMSRCLVTCARVELLPRESCGRCAWKICDVLMWVTRNTAREALIGCRGAEEASGGRSGAAGRGGRGKGGAGVPVPIAGELAAFCGATGFLDVASGVAPSGASRGTTSGVKEDSIGTKNHSPSREASLDALPLPCGLGMTHGGGRCSQLGWASRQGSWGGFGHRGPFTTRSRRGIRCATLLGATMSLP